MAVLTNPTTVAAAFLAGLVAVAFADEANTPTSNPAGGPAALLRDGFEGGLGDWIQAGSAQFAADGDEHHSGARSARIAVPPDANLQGQMLYKCFPAVAHGDWLKASAWVLARDVADGIGAYIMVEFLDANGRRIDFYHPSYSRDRGKAGWQFAEIDALVPKGTASTRLALAMGSHGTAWFDDVELVLTSRHADLPDLGDARREVVIHAGQVVQRKFGGVGFHVFDHVHDASRQMLDEVIEKRWRELNPSFARLNHDSDWDRPRLDQIAARLERMRGTGTEMYMATWNPKDAKTPAELADYARKVVDSLEYLVRTKGLTNLKYYCMSNELSLGEWGALRSDLPRFKAYHQALFDELKARKLDIGLLATDASPVVCWDTIAWAAKNMDEITAVYGGHHYIDEYPLDDEQFYPWFLGKIQWGAALAGGHGKGFILGEFGCKQAPRAAGGMRMDTCAYWDTPQEPMVGIQLSEAAIAAINGGAYATGYWTFADFPDQYVPSGGVPDSKGYANKWGLFKWTRDGNCSTRAPYYAYGLLSKFFRGPATVYKVGGNDPLLRVAAVRHQEAKPDGPLAGTWSIAVVNRNGRTMPVTISMEGFSTPTPTPTPSSAPASTSLSASFRKYVYDPNNVPQNPFGDLQPPSGVVAMKDGRLTDTIGPMTLTVYTTAYDDQPPAPVRGLKIEPAEADGGGGPRNLSWQASKEKDLCYYRVFRGDRPDFAPDAKTQIGSTIATHFTDAKAEMGKEYHYKVQAVDASGNASRSE